MHTRQSRCMPTWMTSPWCPAMKQASETFVLLTARAAAIGLAVNKKKTIAYGPIAERLAAHLDIAHLLMHAPEGFKCLGAWISHDQASIERFLSLAVSHHIEFFNMIAKLDPEVAFAVLRFCGWPRLLYLCRTMEQMGPHAINFDNLAVETFLKVAGISDPLSEYQAALLRLPLTLGGFGLRSYAQLAPQCFAASSDPSSNSEAARTRILDLENAALVDSDPSWQRHRQATAKRHASVWLQSPSSNFAFRGLEFRRALQLRLRYAGSWAPQKTLELCACGFAAPSPQDFEIHLVGCARHSGLGPSTRHNAVRDTVARWLREHGATISLEPEVGNGRADLQVIVPDIGVDEVVDFVVTNETGFSRPSSEAAVARKNRKYGDRNVLVAEASVLGGMGNGFAKFIKAVTQDAGERRELREIALKTIQALNGKIVLRRNPRPIAESLPADPTDSDSGASDDYPLRTNSPHYHKKPLTPVPKPTHKSTNTPKHPQHPQHPTSSHLQAPHPVPLSAPHQTVPRLPSQNNLQLQRAGTQVESALVPVVGGVMCESAVGMASK